MKTKTLAQNVFSLFFERNVKEGSTLTIGGTDANHFSGSFTSTPVTEYSYVRPVPLLVSPFVLSPIPFCGKSD